MRALLKELRNLGKTILISSHILPELADICNKIGIIDNGKLLFDGDLQSAIRQVRQHQVLAVRVANGQDLRARDILAAHPSVRGVRVQGTDATLQVTLHEGITDTSFVAETLVRNGLRLRLLKEEEIDLEDVFMRITKGIGD
jgi:ABC-2 type transport system ATP-binding protein